MSKEESQNLFVIDIKNLLRRGHINDAIELIKKQASLKLINIAEFEDLLFDYNYFKKQDILGAISDDEILFYEKDIVHNLIKKVNKYASSQRVIESLQVEETDQLRNLLVMNRYDELFDFMEAKTQQFPRSLEDRFVRLEFEYQSLKTRDNRGVIAHEKYRLLLSNLTNSTLKLIDVLTDKEFLQHYNDNPLVFVVIAFHESMEPVYALLKELGNNFNLKVIRVKDVKDDFRITDRIISLINRSKFIIADLSLEKPNVYFELGYARGIGKRIITICNKRSDIHFDVKDWTCLFYSDMDDLRKNILPRFESEMNED